MILFKRKKIAQNEELIASELREARANQELKIGEIAQKININQKYLEAMEAGEFNKLPAGLYGKSFLREYAQYLGLHSDDLLELLDQRERKNLNTNKKNLFSPKAPKFYFNLLLPKIIRNVLLSLALLVCFVYLGFSLKEIIAPPALAIYEPADNFTTKENYVNIQGKTEPEAEVLINGKAVLTDPKGQFSEKINLVVGINTISITAQKKYSQKNQIVKNVLVEN
jgi:cytoskeletal protein RodZ